MIETDRGTGFYSGHMRREQFDQHAQFLCHYTSRYAALAHILPMQTLRFSPFGLMRDPLEAKERYIGVAPAPMLFGAGGEALHRDVNERTNHILKRQFKVLSMTADPPEASPDGMFGRGYARPRMWEQYAEGHRGVCLLFSHDALTEAVENQLQGTAWFRQGLVTYLSMAEGFRPDPMVEMPEPPASAGQGIEKLVREIAPTLFFEKYDDYASEQEYRFVVRARRGGDYRYVDCTGTLRAVVLGAEFPQSELTPLLFRCAEQGVALLRMGWRQGLGQIEGFYNPTIPLEHNHLHDIDPYRDRLARWHPTLEEYEA